MLLGIMGRGIAIDFFGEPPDFGADILNKKAITASKTAAMAF